MVGQTLRDSRNKMEKSLTEISKELGYTNHAIIQQVEVGKRHIPKGKIVEWSKVYHLDSKLLERLDEESRKLRKLGISNKSGDNYNLMPILPWIIEASPTALFLRDLRQIVNFVISLDVPINKELITGYINGIVSN